LSNSQVSAGAYWTVRRQTNLWSLKSQTGQVTD